MPVIPTRAYSRLFRSSLRTLPARGSTPTPTFSTISISLSCHPSITSRQGQSAQISQHEPRGRRARFTTTSQAGFRAYTINNDVEPASPTSEPAATIATAAVDPPDYLSEDELKVFEKLKRELDPTKLEVQDISGGCGSMYGLDIVSAKFKGKSIIQQHKIVNQILKEELKIWHGVQLKTKAG